MYSTINSLKFFNKQRTTFTLFDLVFPKTLEMISRQLKALETFKNKNSEKQK